MKRTDWLTRALLGVIAAGVWVMILKPLVVPTARRATTSPGPYVRSGRAPASPVPAAASWLLPTRQVPEASPEAADTVHITKSGTKYHRAGCRSLSRSDIPISRQEAEARGYMPCKVCKP